MSRTLSRGTVTISIEGCKGCELCIPACPPAVLVMSETRNELGVRYPELAPGCTGCGACLLVCPDFCFEVYHYEEPVEHGLRPVAGTETAHGVGS
jgi:2-oxoglutarate ferredoxin oxidoreductase subunit delta